MRKVHLKINEDQKYKVIKKLVDSKGESSNINVKNTLIQLKIHFVIIFE